MNNENAVKDEAGATQPETTPDTAKQPNQAPAGDQQVNKPADDKQDTEVKLTLSQQEADMIHSLLADYDYAWESDQEVDCKRVLVKKDKIGTYPYVKEAPDSTLIKPVYDWINHKWVDKSAKTLDQLTENMHDLIEKNNQVVESQQQAEKNQALSQQQSVAVTKALTKVMEAQQDTTKLVKQMQQVMLSLVKPAVMQSPKTTQPADGTQATQTADTSKDNGGNK